MGQTESSIDTYVPWEKRNVTVLITQLHLTLCDHMDCSSPGSSVNGDSPGKNTGVGLRHTLPGDLPNPEIEPMSPVLQADSLPAEPQGKPSASLLSP